MQYSATVMFLGLIVICLEAQAVQTRPVPPQDAVDAARKEIRQLFKDEIEQAVSAARKSALASKLMQIAQESDKEPASQYALLLQARSLAASASDVNLASRVINLVESKFNGPHLAFKAETVRILADAARTADSKIEAGRAAIVISSEALMADDFETAKNLLRVANDTNDPRLVKLATLVKQQVLEAERIFQDVKLAAEQVERDPTNPAANLVLGKYQCLIKGDWAKGLSHLATCSDAALRSLARDDLATGLAPEAQLDIANRWWTYGEGQESLAGKNAMGRAAYWYGKAAPKLTGLSKVRAEKRIADFRDAVTDTTVENLVLKQLARHDLDVDRDVAVVQFEFSPDNKSLAICADSNSVRLTSTITGETTATLASLSACGRVLRFSPDGQKLITSGKSTKLALWDLAARKPKLLEGHGSPPIAVAFTPDSKTFASFGVLRQRNRMGIIYWALDDGEMGQSIDLEQWNGSGWAETSKRDFSRVTPPIVLLPGNKLLTAVPCEESQFWRTMRSTIGADRDNAVPFVNAWIPLSERRNRIAFACNRGVFVWTDGGQPPIEHVFGAASESAFHIEAASVDPPVAVLRSDSDVVIFDLNTSRPTRLQLVRKKEQPIHKLVRLAAISGTANRVVTTDSGRILTVWNTLSGERLTEIKTPGVVKALAVSHDGNTVAAGVEREIPPQLIQGVLIDHTREVVIWQLTRK